MAELERIADTFGHWEKNEFLNYIWLTTFSEWDKSATTEEATQRANEVQERAELAWKEVKN